MPGMNSGINVNDPTVIAAFKSALVHQGIIALLIFGLLGLVWIAVRARQPTAARANGQPGTAGPAAATVAEPTWRQVLRVGFGLLWVFDGILQAQPKMAIGLPSQVIQPTAASSPHWVQHVVNWAGTSWSYHPMQAGAAAVWIQIGIGIWLLAAPRGNWSRLAGLVSVGWGLVVWVFGESFGAVFAPGLTWLFGAPGAVLIYAVAGALIALPERVWHDPRLGQAILSGLGLFLVAMAVLQAWPGRGFWQGVSHGQRATLADMTHNMAQTPQPGFLAATVRAFTSFDEAHGFAVNLFVVVALALIGAAFLTGRRRLARPALIAFTVLCLADWVLIEDMGVFGGLGTDPNSMIPFILLAVSGYLALAPGTAPATEPATATPAAPMVGWRERVRPASLRRSVATAGFPTIVSLGALGLIILGAAPMAAAQASPNADPILAESIAGSTAALNFPAKGFQLTDQHGQTVSLASLHGKVVLLTFLDPVCTTDCPLIAQEFRAAGQLLGAAAKQVELVAVVTNPVYHQVAYTQAFDRLEHLNQVPNWLYLTGSVPQLQHVCPGAGSVVAGFRPSQALSYSPLATTHDNGTAWTPGLLDAALANVPNALAAAPGGGHLLALLASGQAELSGPGGTGWAKLATRQTLAASPAGRRCGLGGLTAAAFSPSGVPLLAASCTHPGTAGIFGHASGTWRLAGPTLPATYAHQDISVLRLSTTAGTTTALLAAGTGSAAHLLAAWSTSGGNHWALSPPLPLRGAKLTSASSGPGGTVALVLTGNHAKAILGPAGAWRPLPALPPGTATLAPGTTGGWDALAVHGTRLTVWQLPPGRTAWAAAQTINVPVIFGSSG